MRKLREVLRLHFDLKLGQRQIGRSANVGQSTVHDYLTRFATAGLSWPLPAEMTEEGLQAALFPPEEKAERRDPERAFPDYAHLHEELKRHKHVTLQLLWEEYRATQPNGYRYSRFCHYYQQWKQRQDVVMRQTHRAGEKLFVDWAGSKLPLIDPKTGEVWEAPLFVAVLGASNYTYAEALPDEAMTSWLGAHVRSFQFLQGVPTLLVPDNARTGVSKAHRYEPDLNPTYQEMASHYGVGVVPARPYKPRDKAKVEVGVQIAQRWILAALRHRQFFSLREANLAIAELLEKLNQRPFRKREGCRQSLFEEVDRLALRPLPDRPFEIAQWLQATVHIDYHIQFDRSFYSVPYQLVGQKVEVRATPATLEIFHQSQRVASHLRTHKAYTAVTDPEHLAKAHRAHSEWPPSRLIQWAHTVGAHTAQVVERILKRYPHPEMGYRSCLGILRLSKKYTETRVEAASARGLATGAVSYKSLESILRTGLDRQPLPSDSPNRDTVAHPNLRGAEYFQ